MNKNWRDTKNRKFNYRNDSRNDLRTDPKNDPKSDPRTDLRNDPKNDPRNEVVRNDPRNDPKNEVQNDPRTDVVPIDYDLNDIWVIYDHEKSNNRDYDKSTRILGIFFTVGEFLFLRSKFPKPSELFYRKDIGKNYYLFPDNSERDISSISIFRNGILPKWEDPNNINGGEIAIRKFIKKGYTTQECLDEFWNTLVLHCISEQIVNSEFITGLRVVDSSMMSTKKQLYRIELWFSNLEVKYALQKEFMNLFNLTIDDIFFKEHKVITPT